MFSDEVFVTMSTIFGQVCHECNNCPEDKLGKKLLSKEKNSLFFKILSEFTVLIIPQKFARVFKIATFLALEDYEEKQFSKLCTMFKPSSNSEPKSNTFIRKVFGVVTTAIRASRRIFWGKIFLR